MEANIIKTKTVHADAAHSEVNAQPHFHQSAREIPASSVGEGAMAVTFVHRCLAHN